jgi:light-regulated signal transduction histidine kinase (bacteriophytochrome)
VNIELPHLPTILADRALLTLMFHHLLHNALLYHTANNPPNIKITVQNNDNAWTFCIQDNGFGICPTLINNAFLLSKRGVKQQDYPGLGMGLAFVRKIVQLHQGQCHIESQVDIGSKLFVTLPILVNDEN